MSAARKAVEIEDFDKAEEVYELQRLAEVQSLLLPFLCHDLKLDLTLHWRTASKASS